MKAFFAEEQKRHDPKAFLSSGASQPNPEKPERVERLRRLVERIEADDQALPGIFDDERVATAADRELLDAALSCLAPSDAGAPTLGTPSRRLRSHAELVQEAPGNLGEVEIQP